jgi:transcription initiation factor TFIIH subunit 3
MAELANTMSLDAPTHLTLILDLSPKQWHLSSLESNEFSLSLDAFLSQVLAFINAHLAGRHDNTITVFGAFPGTRLVRCAYILSPV